MWHRVLRTGTRHRSVVPETDVSHPLTQSKSLAWTPTTVARALHPASAPEPTTWCGSLKQLSCTNKCKLKPRNNVKRAWATNLQQTWATNLQLLKVPKKLKICPRISSKNNPRCLKVTTGIAPPTCPISGLTLPTNETTRSSSRNKPAPYPTTMKLTERISTSGWAVMISPSLVLSPVEATRWMDHLKQARRLMRVRSDFTNRRIPWWISRCGGANVWILTRVAWYSNTAKALITGLQIS